MYEFNRRKFMYRMSRTLLWAVPPDFLILSGSYEATFRTSPLPRNSADG